MSLLSRLKSAVSKENRNSSSQLDLSSECGHSTLVLLFSSIGGILFILFLLLSFLYTGSDSALHQAAVEAARCVVPTEGNCLLAKNGELDFKYGWYAEKKPRAGDERFSVDLLDYEANLYKGTWSAKASLEIETPINPDITYGTTLVPSERYALKLNRYENRRRTISLTVPAQNFKPVTPFVNRETGQLVNFPEFDLEYEQATLDNNIMGWTPVNMGSDDSQEGSPFEIVRSNSELFKEKTVTTLVVRGDIPRDGIASVATCESGMLCGVSDLVGSVGDGATNWRKSARVAFKLVVGNQIKATYSVEGARIYVYDEKGILVYDRDIGGRDKGQSVSAITSGGAPYDYGLWQRGPAGAHGGGDSKHSNFYVPRGGHFDVHVPVKNYSEAHYAYLVMAYYYDKYESVGEPLTESRTFRLIPDILPDVNRVEGCCMVYTSKYPEVTFDECMDDFEGTIGEGSDCFRERINKTSSCEVDNITIAGKKVRGSFDLIEEYEGQLAQGDNPRPYLEQVSLVDVPMCKDINWKPSDIWTKNEDIPPYQIACGWESIGEGDKIEVGSITTGMETCSGAELKENSETFKCSDNGIIPPSVFSNFNPNSCSKVEEKKQALKQSLSAPELAGDYPTKSILSAMPAFSTTGTFSYGTPRVLGVSTRSSSTSPDTMVLNVGSESHEDYVKISEEPDGDKFELNYSCPELPGAQCPDFHSMPESNIQKFLEIEKEGEEEVVLTGYPFDGGKEGVAEIPWWGLYTAKGRDFDFDMDCDIDLICEDREFTSESLEEVLRQYAARVSGQEVAYEEGVEIGSQPYKFSYQAERLDRVKYLTREEKDAYRSCTPFQRVACGEHLMGEIVFLGEYGVEGPPECQDGTYVNCEPVPVNGQNFNSPLVELYDAEAIESRVRAVAEEVMQDIIPFAETDCEPREKNCMYVTVDLESASPDVIIDVGYNYPIMSPFNLISGIDYIPLNYRKREALEIKIHG